MRGDKICIIRKTIYIILFYENHKDELDAIILNYILIKSMIYASEVIEKVVSNIEQRKRGDKNV